VLTIAVGLTGITSALAASTESSLKLTITPDLKVQVSDQWAGLQQANGKFEYFSAAREHGTIPVDVRNGGFKVSFETESYLRKEGGLFYLVTPDFYYPAGPLDVHCTVEYPAALRFLDAKPAPNRTGGGRLEWDLADCSHSFILARFEPAAGARRTPEPTPARPPAMPAAGEPAGSQVLPAELPQLVPGELPRNADEALTEMRNILRVAELQHSTDPQFIRVMNKVLAKFYYLFDKQGVLPPRMSPAPQPAAAPRRAADKPAPQPSAPSQGGSEAGSPRFRGIW
jgi:hypothetical protein